MIRNMVRDFVTSGNFSLVHNIKGYAVAQLVEELHYKSEGRGFDFPDDVFGIFH